MGALKFEAMVLTSEATPAAQHMLPLGIVLLPTLMAVDLQNSTALFFILLCPSRTS